MGGPGQIIHVTGTACLSASLSKCWLNIYNHSCISANAHFYVLNVHQLLFLLNIHEYG